MPYIMTIDEAIQHAREVAERLKNDYRLCPYPTSECDGKTNCRCLKDGKDKGCLKCAEEHRQLAEWLKELKWWRTRYRGSCSACRYTTRKAFEEPCISCKPEAIDKWVCGYESGDMNEDT